MERKGIILAGGKGTRLRPVTLGVSKPLLPVYDKPMVYYPISVLMQAGIREIAIITTPEDQAAFQRALGDGSQWGVRLEWIVQPSADGIAQAYILAEEFLDGHPSVLVLGDNLFLGHGLEKHLYSAAQSAAAATVFAYEVQDPERFGVVAFDGARVTGLVEKPVVAPSNYAVTGLYFLDGDAPRRARDVRPSERGELEIVSLLETYLDEGTLTVERLGSHFDWFDAGTHDSLLEAAIAVKTLQKDGDLFGSPDAEAFRNGWTSVDDVDAALSDLGKTGYAQTLRAITAAAADDLKRAA